MKTLTRNQKGGIAAAAVAMLLSAGLLHGCAYEPDYVQINDGATSTSDANVSLTIHAENSDGVYAYYIAEKSADVSPETPGAGVTWQSIPNASTVFDKDEVALGLAGPGARTVYVWFKDAYGSVSEPVSDTITYGSAGGGGSGGY